MTSPFWKRNCFCRYNITHFLSILNIATSYGFVTFVKSNALLPLTLRIKGRRSARLMPLHERHSLLQQNLCNRLLIRQKYRLHSLWVTVPKYRISVPYHRLPHITGYQPPIHPFQMQKPSYLPTFHTPAFVLLHLHSPFFHPLL